MDRQGTCKKSLTTRLTRSVPEQDTIVAHKYRCWARTDLPRLAGHGNI